MSAQWMADAAKASLHRFAEIILNENTKDADAIRDIASIIAKHHASADKAQSAGSDLSTRVHALEHALRDIAEYTGEGPPTTPWQEIVRDISNTARAALSPGRLAG